MDESQVNKPEQIKHFTLETFKKAFTDMIATNDNSYSNGIWSSRNLRQPCKDYSLDEIKKIIESGSLTEQRTLSQNYFYKNGFYRRILIYYATIFKYEGILIPKVLKRKRKLTEDSLQDRYYKALSFCEKIGIPSFLDNCALRALINGAYYGLVVNLDSKNFSVLDLPIRYCSSNFKDANNNDLIEFDVTYFSRINDEGDRASALAAYPKNVQRAYKRFHDGKTANKWVMLPVEKTICFSMYDGRPLFLSLIPATILYDEAVQLDMERDKDEIKKILIQKVPHTNDGALLFEPEEAEIMHNGAVQMLKKNKNVDILTTYTDAEIATLKTTNDNNISNLEKMVNNIYYEAGASSQLFAATGNLSLENSITNDTAFMSPLINKFSNYLTNIINTVFANNIIEFKYNILPITNYNYKDYLKSSLSLANSGYSFILPAIAAGLSQSDLCNIKALENDVLKLSDLLIPLSTAYTQSGDVSDVGGAPKKEEDEKSPRTIENEKSLDNQGGN